MITLSKALQAIPMLLFIASLQTSVLAKEENLQTPRTDDTNNNTLLSGNERAWIAAHPVLKNGVVDGHAPFEFVDEEGRHIGLTSDYLNIIGSRLGVRFETVTVNSFQELGEQMQLGTIDVSSYLPTPIIWDDVLSFTDPVIRMPIAVFGSADSTLVQDIASLSQWKVAVERPSRAYEFLSRDWPQLQFMYVDSPAEGLIAVSNGEVDYFIHNIFSVEYNQRHLGLPQFKIAATTPYTFDIRFGVNKELAPLIPIMQKVMVNLSDYERKLVFDKWVNIPVNRQFNWQLLIYWSAAILLIVLSGLAAILYWNRRLAHEVASRTRDLEHSKDELRALARHMDDVREEEKSRIAREMHDELGHTLTALAMTVRRVAKLHEGAALGTGGNNAQGVDPIGEMRGLVKEASRISRRIMSDLRPSVLEDLGLVAAIEWLVHEFEMRHNATCELMADDLAVQLPPGAEIALFRIVQESLTNIAKHANATAARVVVDVTDGTLTLTISDNGDGLPTHWESIRGSYGLLGMSERAVALGGRMHVSNGSKSGVCVLVSLPLVFSEPDGSSPVATVPAESGI